MRKNTLAILIVISSWNCALSADEPSLRIRSLSVDGAQAISRSRILGVMETHGPSLLQRLPFIRYPEYDETLLRRDVSVVESLYRSEGYYRADVSFEADTINTHFDVTINITEGEPALIDEVKIVGIPRDLNELERMVELRITLREGRVFRVEDYDASLDSVRDYLVNNGYGAADVEASATVDMSADRVSIIFKVEPGPLQRFGSVSVIGNEIVRPEDINGEADFSYGEIFSRNKLDRTRANIFRLDLFSMVTIFSPEPEAEYLPIAVDVEERPFRSVNAGFGYGTEDKIRGTAEWTRRYLFRSLRTVTISGEYSALLRGVNFQLAQRYFLSRRTNLVFDLGVDREDAATYINERIVSQVRTGIMFSEQFNAFSAFRVEINNPAGVEESVQEEILATRPGEFFRIASIQGGLNYSHLDYPAFPRSGGMYSIYMEPATFLVGSQVDYFKTVAEVRTYLSAGTFVIAARVKAGGVEPLRDTRVIPVFKRFFAGGSYSVRGYDYQALGPTDASGEPVGGNSILEANIELRHPIFGNLWGALFLDAGNVYGESFHISTSDLRYGTGAGLRYETPVGPVGFDVAVPFDYGEALRFEEYRFYFSIGHAI